MGATPPLWIPAFAGMTNSVAGTIHFRTKRHTFSLTETMCPGGDLCVNAESGGIVISVKSDSVSRRWRQPDGGIVEAVP